MRSARDITPTFMVDTETENGKLYEKNVMKMLEELKMLPSKDNENFKSVKKLNDEQMKKYAFLETFLDKFKADEKGGELFKMLTRKNIIVGRFNRKAGYVFRPSKENLFRFFIHLGDNEAYYLDSSDTKDKIVPMISGSGFILPPHLSMDTACTVYSNPIRILADSRFQEFIPKIRMKNYQRVTLVLEYEMNVPDDSQKAQNPKNSENVQNVQNTENSENTQNSENVQNGENSENVQNGENSENV